MLRRFYSNHPRFVRAARGAILGALLGAAAGQLNVDVFVHQSDHFPAYGAALGLVLSLTRFRDLLWTASALVVVALVAVCYTPLAPSLMRAWVCADPPEPAPAVVVLSADFRHDGSFSAPAQDRLLHAFDLLRRGDAPRLVLTRPPEPDGAPWIAGVHDEMQTLGLTYPTEEVGPVHDTHDEALAVARLARDRGWNRVILVTQPWHMRRAAAVFQKAGVDVVRSPANESRYDLADLDNPGGRLRAWTDWSHEAVGYLYYRLRGWI